MAREDELIPFSPGFPPGRRWLFLAAHPDDETFGPGATLAMGRERGVEIRLVVVTDGQAQGDPVVRARAVDRAASALGLDAPERWRLQDRALRPGDRLLRQRLASAFTGFKPDLVLVPAPVDLHTDHRALALAVQHAVRRGTLGGLLDRAPTWVAAYEVGSPLLPNLLVAADAGWPKKVAAAACHADQDVHWPYREYMDALGVMRRLTLKGCSRAEALHLLPARLVARLSASGWAARMGSPAMIKVRAGQPRVP